MTLGTSWREELIRRLEAGPSLLETFVLLWSYFEEAGLRQAESRLHQLKIHPLRIPLDLPKEGTQEQGWLQEKRQALVFLAEGELDYFAAVWLRSIDELLEHKTARLHQSIPGLDGNKKYLVHRRREILAKRLAVEEKRASAWVGAQNNAIEAYAKFHKAVRADRVDGCKIVTQAFRRTEHVTLRRLATDWEDGHFKVMLWPFETLIRYQGLDVKDLSGGSGGAEVNFVHLREVENEAELLAEIPNMLEAARKEKVTLLLLPELAVPPITREAIRRHLADQAGYPLLTLVGLCHRQVSKQGVDVNEAILLGHDGTEVHRHPKLVPYTGLSKDGITYISENLEPGNTLTVLELPFGNLCVVICADLFQMERLLADSHATVLAVPSLSSKTSAHHDTAKALANKNRACTFVTNRWLGAHSKETTSFYQLPLKKEDGGYKAHIEDPANEQPHPRYLLFTLP